MLGRAVSLLDYEAVAANTTGVRAAKAEWQWSGLQQRPVVKLWYIGQSEVGAIVQERLVAISAEGVPFEIEAANAIAATLHVTLVIDPDYQTDAVIGHVAAANKWRLRRKRSASAEPLSAARVLAWAATIAGVIAPTGLAINGYPYLVLAIAHPPEAISSSPASPPENSTWQPGLAAAREAKMSDSPGVAWLMMLSNPYYTEKSCGR